MGNMFDGERKFKVGDRIRCVEEQPLHGIHLGKTYTVTDRGYGSFIGIDNIGSLFFKRRFVLVPSKPIVKSDWL